MSTSARPAEASIAERPAPTLLYFPADEEARRILREIARKEPAPYNSSVAERAEPTVLLVCDPNPLAEHAPRHDHLRVIVMSNDPFGDPALDALVYSYVPRGTSAALIERLIENATSHIHLSLRRHQLDQMLTGASHEIHELNRIGAALSAERDTSKLLEMILTKCRKITHADAGSLYLVEQEDTVVPTQQIDPAKVPAHGAKAADVPAPDVHKGGAKVLRFKLAQNDSVSVPFREVTIPISEQSIAGYVALRGETVNIADAYDLPAGVPYSINRTFDEDSGYRTGSILAVPMRDQKDEIVGVVQLINAKCSGERRIDDRQDLAPTVIPFSKHQQEIVASLASQAAVAYENSQLYAAIQRLFEGFVRASVTAIEARDPTTSGHSFRVANLTVALAEVVDRSTDPLFAAINFTRSEMKEIRYASLLHDFGKVGVREEVLVKAKKLYPGQLELIQQRFDYAKRTIENESLNARVQCLLEKSREEYFVKQPELDADLMKRLQQLDKYFATIASANEPTVLPEGSFDSLNEIMRTAFHTYNGDEQPLLREDEARLLSIRKGSLDDAERLQIESHVVHSYNFLSQIPWTTEIKHIPTIARGHHEKLNGLGYPYKLSAPSIPIQTRMMTISDIFDALSASDRPYKKAVSQDRALEILDLAVKDGEIDGSLMNLFIEGRVFDRWKIEPFPY